jgi:hypothetical protein
MKFIIIVLASLIVLASAASNDTPDWNQLSDEQRACFIKAYSQSSDSEKVPISPTFYEQFFMWK